MWNHAKFNETAQTVNFIDFPLISCGNGPYGPKLCKRKRGFLCCKNLSEVSRVCHMNADVLPILKLWLFLLCCMLNRSYCCSKLGQIWIFFLEKGGVKKIDMRFFKSSWVKFLNGIYKLHQFWPHLTPLAIHRWKAMDLRFNLAPSFRDLKHPTSRQNFYDTLEQTPMVDLRNLSRESLQGTHQARDCAKPK